MTIHQIGAVLRGLVVAGSAGYLALYAGLAALRVKYPFDLEWLEGAMVDHVRVILEGRALYPPPTLDFIPLTYTPGYFYVAAALCKVAGLGVIPLRLISIAPTFCVLAMTSRLVTYETGDGRFGLLAAGLFAAMFGWTGGWLDIARNDSLFLLLAMLSVYVLRRSQGTAGAALAGALISLSFLTKQTGLIVAVPLALWCATRGWRRFTAFAGTALVLIGGSSVLLDRAFDGWYLYYIYFVPRQHPVAMQSILGFWRYDLAGPLPLALAAALTYLGWELMRGHRERAWFYLLVAIGFVAGAWISRLHSLSYVNVVLPAHLMTAIVFALAAHHAVERLAPRMRRPELGVAMVYAVCALQILRAAYSPAGYVPTADDVAAGESLVQQIARAPGDVFVPFHGDLPRRAGKASFAHAVMLSDVIRGGRTTTELELAAALSRALRTRRFESVFAIDSKTPVHEWLPIAEGYAPAGLVVSRTSRFWRPERLHLPK